MNGESLDDRIDAARKESKLARIEAEKQESIERREQSKHRVRGLTIKARMRQILGVFGVVMSLAGTGDVLDQPMGGREIFDETTPVELFVPGAAAIGSAMTGRRRKEDDKDEESGDE